MVNALDSRAFKFSGADSDEEVAGENGFIDIGKRERKATVPAAAPSSPLPVAIV